VKEEGNNRSRPFALSTRIGATRETASAGDLGYRPKRLRKRKREIRMKEVAGRILDPKVCDRCNQSHYQARRHIDEIERRSWRRKEGIEEGARRKG